MAYLQLPARSDVPAYEYQIELEKVLYGISIYWNARADHWHMDLTDASGVALACGVKLLTGWPLLLQYKTVGLPPGSFFCLDTSGQDLDPKVSDLGTRVLLMYRESGTVDE